MWSKSWFALPRRAAQRGTIALLALIGVTLASAPYAVAVQFLISENDSPVGGGPITLWDPSGGPPTAFHTGYAGDADYNLAEGSPDVWIVDHFDDNFARFVPGAPTGFDQVHSFPEAFPKHVSVFDGHVYIASRNTGRLYKYDFAGNVVDTVSGANPVQGIATDGTSLFVSRSDRSAQANAISSFDQYDAAFNLVNTIANPSGVGTLGNIFDFAYDRTTGHFFGLAANDERGTPTESDVIYEFTMGGAVLATHSLPFGAAGIGQFNVPEPSSFALAWCSALAVGLRRSKTGQWNTRN